MIELLISSVQSSRSCCAKQYLIGWPNVDHVLGSFSRALKSQTTSVPDGASMSTKPVVGAHSQALVKLKESSHASSELESFLSDETKITSE